MLAFKLALRNLIGAGIRTWLNVIVLCLTFIFIIWMFGFINGWNIQARVDMRDWEIGGGQYWEEDYDPYDMFTLEISHSRIPEEVENGISDGIYCPVLINQATIYPQGRMRNILMKGIDPDQKVLDLPTKVLGSPGEEIPVIIGTSMAKATKLKQGDITTIRWRDSNGTFDAAELVVAGIFRTNVPTVDVGQVWISLERLQQMAQMPGEATILVVSPELKENPPFLGWIFKDTDSLMEAINATIKTKSFGVSIILFVLMALGLLAVFDTQVLSIFRRQKEIGTYVAMGMTRGQVVRLFTVEGAMHSLLAVILGAIIGTPFLWLFAKTGFAMPEGYEEFGLALAEKIYPAYGTGLIVGTMLLVFLSTTIVSYLPSRKIARMNPTEAIRGKIQ